MNTRSDYVGADGGGSYPEIAARAVRGVSQQHSSPAYGYFRAPVEGISRQRIYLFNTLEEARGWFMGLVHAPAQLYDYAAVFTAADLSQPALGLESFGHTMVGGDTHVGNVWPFLLGLPFGALGGYFYRGWQDEHPGQWIPGISGDYSVGGPWVDTIGNDPYGRALWLNNAGNDPYGRALWLNNAGNDPYSVGNEPYSTGNEPYVGGPWLDLAGPHVGGPWVDLAGPHVGGPWVDLAGPHVGGPWLDLAGPHVGGPWLDLAGPHVDGPWVDLAGPHVGGPWVDIAGPHVGGDLVGAELDVRERRRSWLQTKALIESAKREVIDAQARAPAAAWVWSFDPTGPLPGTVTELSATQLTPFSSVEQAQAYMFERIQMPHVALALFDTAARRHWPNPVRWTKSDDPSYEALIAQRVAQYAPTRTAGDYVGADLRGTSIGTALGDVRDRARALANKRAGDVVGVIHTTKDNLWHALAFRNVDDADDWLETQDQPAYTYAAYYDKNDATWPNPVVEKIGGLRAPKMSRSLVGAGLEDTRVYAKTLATAKPGTAAGVVRSVEGAWSTYAFPSLDAAIDWLSSLTAHRGSFAYAGAFEKDADGTAYVQQEEFGTRPGSPSQRAIAATSGGYARGAA